MATDPNAKQNFVVNGVPDITAPNSLAELSNLTQQISQSWVTTQFFPNDIPELTDFKASFDGIAKFLVAILEIVNQIMQVVKVFITAYTNPIQTLAKVLIEQLQALINDIKAIGFYLTSDVSLFKWPFPALRGGYTAYEQRTIAKLVDQSDPTRPVVSNSTYVLGVFF